MDIEQLIEQIAATLRKLEPSGKVSNIEFFNTGNEDEYRAELHLRDGKLAFFHVYSKEECERQRVAHRARTEECND